MSVSMSYSSVLRFFAQFTLLIAIRFSSATGAAIDSQDGVTASTVFVNGAGATFPEGVYVAWMAAYRSVRLQFVDVRMSYAARGSGFGKLAITNQSAYGVAYAGSDSVLVASDYNKSADLQMFPAVAGAIVLGYNLPGISNLVLTREQVVGIYNGTFTQWSDPTFHTLNPTLVFPNASIVPVARYDSSGTTEIFTRALSAFSGEWSRRYGIFTTTAGWNSSVVKTFGQRTTGLADAVNNVRYRIGYMTPASAAELQLPYATILNKHGLAVPASRGAVQLSMEERTANMTDRLTGVLVDCDDPNTYPIAGYTYLIVHLSESGDCRTYVELVRYIEWFTTTNQASVEADNQMMVSVSPAVSALIQSHVLDRMTCNGKSVMDMAQRQIYDELESLKTWKVPVEVATPLVAVLIILLMVYALRQRLQYLRMFDRDDWKISFYDIEVHAPKASHGGTASAKPAPKAMSVEEPSSKVPASSSLSSTPMRGFRGTWNVCDISVRSFHLSRWFAVSRKVRYSLVWIRETITHENIAKFYGLTFNGDEIFLVEEYCEKGYLKEMLRNNRYQMTESMRYSVAADVANGMAFLHRHNIIHGNLTMSSCMVDSHLTVKIVGWEYVVLYEAIRKTKQNKGKPEVQRSMLHHFRVVHDPTTSLGQSVDVTKADLRASRNGSTVNSTLRCAPELLGNGGRFEEPTRAGDVYNFGFVVGEIFEQSKKDEGGELSASDIETSVPTSEPSPQRDEENNRMPNKAKQIVNLACSVESVKRPTFEQLEKSLRSAVGNGRGNLIDSVVNSVENYASDLEQKLAAARHQCSQLSIATNHIMRRMLPSHVIDDVWPPSDMETRTTHDQQVSVESFEDVPLLGLHLRINRKTCSSSDVATAAAAADNEMTSLKGKFIDMVERELADRVDIVRLEQSSNMAIIGAFSSEHLSRLASISVRFADEMRTIWNDSQLSRTGDTVCSLLMAIHSGRLVCGLKNSGHLSRYVINGEARDVLNGLLVGVNMDDSTDSQFRVILSEHAAKQISDAGTFAVDRTTLSPLVINGNQLATYWLTEELQQGNIKDTLTVVEC